MKFCVYSINVLCMHTRNYDIMIFPLYPQDLNVSTLLLCLKETPNELCGLRLSHVVFCNSDYFFILSINRPIIDSLLKG